MAETQGRNLEAGAETENMEACYTGLFFSLSEFSYTTQAHLANSSTSHSGLYFHTSMINQENVPLTCLPGNLMVMTQ